MIDGAAHGVIYRESFFTPARHLAAGQRLEEIVAGLEEGLAAAEAETGTRVVLIADMDRAFGSQAGRELVEGIIELQRAGRAQRVVGIGMDSTELGIDPREFAAAYRLAGAAGLHRTAHQGENSPAAAILLDVELLGAERIDHGFTVLEDAGVTRRLVEGGIPITVCPISNLRIANLIGRLEDHPWPRMRAAGLRVTLNTDDPALLGIDLGVEYAALADAHSYGFDQMVAIAVAGAEASWLDDSGRRDLKRRIEQAASSLHPVLP